MLHSLFVPGALDRELHLQRTRRLAPPENAKYWRASWRDVGWEEAMRAWRIIVPTILESLYRVPPHSAARKKAMRQQDWLELRLFPDQPRSLVKTASGKSVSIPTEKWFEPRTLLPDAAAYFAGGYLQTMLSSLYVVIAMALLALFATVFMVEARWQPVAAIVSATAAAGCAFMIRRLNGRKRLLESGALSIHSCAILWQASISAHYRALSSVSEGGRRPTYKGYTHSLGETAVEYVEHVDRLPDLLEE